jgi:predicted RNA polymerase sigma factor
MAAAKHRAIDVRGARADHAIAVELKRAVAVGMALGPAAGRAIVELLIGEPSLKHYHLLPGVRGDLLPKMGTPRRSARRVRASGADDAKQARA